MCILQARASKMGLLLVYLSWQEKISHSLDKRIHWRLSTISKTSKNNVWSNIFWYVKVCIFWKCTQYTINWDKTQMLKKKSFGQNKHYKKCPLFFFHKLQLITASLWICDSYMRWRTRFVSLKLCVGFSIFGSVPFLLKFLFLFNKMHGLFDCKTSLSHLKLK